MNEVQEIDYLYIKEVLLEIQRGHCRLRDKYEGDKKELRKLMRVYEDILETYASHICCDDGYVPPLNVDDFFKCQGLEVGQYE